MAAVSALLWGAIVVFATGAGANRIYDRQLEQDWTCLKQVEREIADAEERYKNTGEAFRSVWMCSFDQKMARDRINAAMIEVNQLRARHAPAAEIQQSSEALQRLEGDFDKWVDKMEMFHDAIHRLKVRLANLEVEREKLAKVFAGS